MSVPGFDVAGNAVGPARGRGERQARCFKPFGDFRGQWDALRRAGCIVDENCLVAAAFGRIEDQSRADFADRCRAVALVARKLQDRRLVEVIAGEVLVDVAQDRVALQERRQAFAGARNFEAGVDGVGKVAGIAQHVPGRHAEAFAVVKVGNSAWLLRRLTPSRAIAAMVGAVWSSTMRKRSPSATKRTTLCGRAAGACAKTANESVTDRIVEPSNSSGRMAKLHHGKRALLCR